MQAYCPYQDNPLLLYTLYSLHAFNVLAKIATLYVFESQVSYCTVLLCWHSRCQQPACSGQEDLAGYTSRQPAIAYMIIRNFCNVALDMLCTHDKSIKLYTSLEKGAIRYRLDHWFGSHSCGY